MRQKLAAFFLFFVVIFSIPNSRAQELQKQEIINQTIEGRVLRILEEKASSGQIYQKLEIVVTGGIIKGKKVTVENGNISSADNVAYEVGDELVMNRIVDANGSESIYITDYVRRNALIWLFVIFIIAAVLVGRLMGFMSLIGMGFSFVVIFKFILPLISAGYNPLLVAIAGAITIVPATFLLSHGINKKTFISIAGTLVSLLITGLLAHFFVNFARLTGFASEEANFIQAYRPGAINMKGLLMAGIIIGGLGVFDDVTVSQAAIVQELKNANARLSAKELYFRAMKIGHDHIASVVNTLVLVYAGAAMPLLLLFVDNSRPISEVINYEFIADEIIRTLVASIGLILAVPITTIIAAYLFDSDTDLFKKKSTQYNSV